MPQAPVGEEGHFHEHQHVATGRTLDVGDAGPAVLVDREPGLLRGRPYGVVDRIPQRRHAGIGRDRREEDAPEAVVLRPVDLGHGGRDVVGEDLGESAPDGPGSCGTPVGQPPVVRRQPGLALFVLQPAGRWANDELTGGEERRHGVGEHDLGRLQIGLELPLAIRRCPSCEPEWGPPGPRTG